MDKEQLKKILELHKKWLNDEDGGERADLSRADLSRADLFNADLFNADLSRADLRYADLSRADLSRADLRYADLSNADLSNADLRYANLSNANLRYANLRYANLSNADLSNADLSRADLIEATLDGKNKLTKPVITMSMPYWVLITEFEIRIGCKKFSHDEFMAVTEDQAGEMDGIKAREFLKMYRASLIELIKTYKET